VNLEARQFFATIRPDIAEAMTSKRRDLLKVLASEHPELMREFQEAQRHSATKIAFFKIQEHIRISIKPGSTPTSCSQNFPRGSPVTVAVAESLFPAEWRRMTHQNICSVF